MANLKISNLIFDEGSYEVSPIEKIYDLMEVIKASISSKMSNISPGNIGILLIDIFSLYLFVS
jgi:hypothetical protein